VRNLEDNTLLLLVTLASSGVSGLLRRAIPPALKCATHHAAIYKGSASNVCFGSLADIPRAVRFTPKSRHV